MKDRRHLEIKNRMLKYTTEVWGIKDARRLDPVIDLLLDVFSFEISRLYQEIQNSDTQLLHSLSRILVCNQWSLPMPSHGLMTVLPGRGEDVLTPEDQFFAEKSIFGKESFSLFFTSLARHQLTDAQVKLLVYDTDLSTLDPYPYRHTRAIARDHKIQDYSLWVGIEISPDYLEETTELPFCILPDNGKLLPHLNLLTVTDSEGTQIPVRDMEFEANHTEESHYFSSIASFYQDQFFVLDLSHCSKQKKAPSELFDGLQENVGDVNLSEELFWFKLNLPEVFITEEIAKVRIHTNTFPVVNRFLQSRQHNFKTNGKIIAMPSRRNSLFLNVGTVDDNRGSEYINILKSNDEELEGTFNLYFGDIERFDSSNARSLIHKIFRLIREDGNAFASMNTEAIDNRLKDLISRLDEFERQIGEADIEDQKDRAFLQVNPYKDSTFGLIKYWLTNGDWANGLNENTLIQQFDSEKFDTPSLRFRTTTLGGVVRRNEQELIGSLRYGLLTRGRIISREDVRSFVLQQFDNNHIKDLIVRNGVSISPNTRGGLVRTTEIVINLKNNTLKSSYLSKFASYLERELASRSVGNSPYRVLFNPTA